MDAPSKRDLHLVKRNGQKSDRAEESAKISPRSGSSGIFDAAIGDFAVEYVDQVQAQRDHRAFCEGRPRGTDQGTH
jgi:hypothetical protein